MGHASLNKVLFPSSGLTYSSRTFHSPCASRQAPLWTPLWRGTASPFCTGSSSEKFPRSLPPTSSHHHPPHPQFKGLNFSPGSAASHRTGDFRQCYHGDHSLKSPVSALRQYRVYLPMWDHLGETTVHWWGSLQCCRGLTWRISVSDGAGTQGPPSNSWSDPASGGLASQILSAFRALHLLADFIDF